MLSACSGIPSLPSPYLSSAVSSFESRLAAYRARVEELERLQQPATQGRDQLEHALPAVLHNVHTFFLHVAAQVSRQTEGGSGLCAMKMP